MRQELIAELKKEMGYSEETDTCQSCEFSEEVEDPMIDRSWSRVCTIHKDTLGVVPVEDDGHCRHCTVK